MIVAGEDESSMHIAIGCDGRRKRAYLQSLFEDRRHDSIRCTYAGSAHLKTERSARTMSSLSRLIDVADSLEYVDNVEK